MSRRCEGFIRLWRLYLLLARSEGTTVQQAAYDLGCTVRTVWRDLYVLEAAGMPVIEKGMDDRRTVFGLLALAPPTVGRDGRPADERHRISG